MDATFKEDISIYFDENPHDGLHEHHEVDDSLREKLKSLILIPIVFQTYCDPKCFAWEHEFKVFVEQAGNDQFGLKPKLAGGNVASRVLSVKIHDLDSEDVKLFESEVDVVMRSIDFIYKDTGVNRPLSEHGLIIGAEMQNNFEDIPYIVAHELIHFNQNYPESKNTLLSQSIKEGSADFVGELISGKHINESASNYGNANEELLCKEFVELMEDNNYHGWLYGSNGKKEGRPNDLGYWIGYKICETYYSKVPDKTKAIQDILNITDFKEFLRASGYLSEYLSK